MNVLRSTLLAVAMLGAGGTAWAVEALPTLTPELVPGDAAVAPAPADHDPLSRALAERLAGQEVVVIGDRILDAEDLHLLYEGNGFEPFWVSIDGPTPQALAVGERLAAAAEEGLEPADYYPELIAELIARDDVASLVSTELVLSVALMRYGADVQVGRLEPRRLHEMFDYRRREVDRPAIVRAAAAAADIERYLDDLAPPHQGYAELRELLARYRAMEHEPLPTVPDGPTLRPGERSDRVPALRARLAATGEYVPQDNAPEASAIAVVPAQAETAAGAVGGAPEAETVVDELLYDEATEAAVRRYQEKYGLAVDGIVGPRTLRSLNRGPEDRIGQIIASMERFRWLPRDLGDRYILVNIPDYSLELVEDGQLVRTMDVIVGRPTRETPLFSSRLTYLEFNPTWTVPTSIAEKDYLPHLIRDPGYLYAHNIRLFSGWGPDAVEMTSHTIDWAWIGSGIRQFMLRQDPGPGNSLGKVKFMMANNFSVYLHDTPSRGLFQRAERAFSSGCVRIADPLWLADYLLQDSERWTPSYRAQVLGDWVTRRINLPEPMPLHIAYITAWIGEDGEPVFREDVYDVDAMVLAALAERAATDRKVALAE